ncbi:tetratricopeptide repeat protein [Bradyrhizobium erythrophlei]|uniref:Tetratricopeptide repeat-containing protein n=1 Tax=Bradyrhizobium erythrophlei TaxID=1437360 RepID=A0A1H4NQU0_9BRAD|nr:tetratricopeptide repeat protein [Bradyrhizobium erythrophlei]SEB97469.1 Tetratricopeptide repeat-containing protein [Bradyrhizobium erythrophlei]
MRLVFFFLAYLSSMSASFASNDFDYLIGKWTPITGPKTGDPFWFSKAFAGYDANIPWWGQAAIVESEGKYGSHLKVAAGKGGANAECFYYVSKIGERKMAWNLRYPPNETSECPGSLVFERENSGELDASLKRVRGFLQSTDYDTALSEANAAVKIDGSSPAAFEIRGEVNWTRKNYSAALSDFSDAIRLCPESDTLRLSRLYLWRGVTHANLKEMDQAVGDYSSVIRLSPDGPYSKRGLNNRGWIYYDRNNFSAAKRDFEAALAKDPNYENARNGLNNTKERLATVDMNFCNDTSTVLWVAVSAGQWPSTDAVVRGWYEVDPKKCETVGRVSKSVPFLFIADGTDGRKWRGEGENSRRICINNKTYNRKVVPQYRCSPDETLQVFHRTFFGENEYEHTERIQ